jgi:F-type H+-transporting ATPase subunit epsilon
MFTLTLVTPQKKIVEDAELTQVFVPAFRGELEILPGHAPLVTTLQAGVMKFKLAGQSETKSFAISWGYCEVTAAGQVTVLAETAEAPEEINVKAAEDKREEALKKMATTTFEEFPAIAAQFQQAEAQLKTVKKETTVH